MKMGGLNFLTSNDFTVQRGDNGNILCNKIHGISLVLFYSTVCIYCEELLPIFRELPKIIKGCIFGIINVSNNKECVKLSEQTIVPIKYVPMIILYVNGKPYMKYTGQRDIKSIQSFIVEVANNVQNRQSFTKGTVKETTKSIPAYTIGKPLYGNKKDKICYLEMDNAYTK